MIVFIDTETTGLRPDRRAWDVALIARRPGEEDVEHQWFVSAHDLDLANADPFGLRVGRFYERHPQYNGTVDGWRLTKDEDDVLGQVEAITRGAHLVGAVPSFDADVLDRRMREHGILPSWHYHLIDVETLAVGYLRGLAAHGHSSATCSESPNCEAAGGGIPLPWKSDDLSAHLGVSPPSDEERHTAMGDARWVRRLYDSIMGKS